MKNNKTYLGDGLYASHDGFMYWLTAENGVSVQNSVALESDVLESFIRYIEKVSKVKITIVRDTGPVPDKE